MAFGDMIDRVGRTTKRPDKADNIKDAINDAIEFVTTQGSFAADLVEGNVAIDSSVYSQSLVISTTFTRFRKIKYLRPSGYTKFIGWHDSSRIFDANGRECTDVWYRAGDNLVFKLSNRQSSMLYGYYQYPARMDDEAAENWMLEQMHALIHAKACAQVFDEIGDAQESARYEGRAGNLLLAHIHDKMDSVSHS